MPVSEADVELLKEKIADPLWFAEQILGIHLWSKQQEILLSVRENRRTAVRACHGPGKTLTAAVAVLWFLYAYPDSRVITTATTWTQVRGLLWHEINRLHRGARYPLGGVLLQTELRLPDNSYALGLSTKPEHQESFQGHHALNILVVYDEASGIPQSIFDTGEGYMTTPGARMLMVGNPTQPAGEFHSAFHAKRKDYSTISISAFDTPNFTDEKVPEEVAQRLVSKEWVEERRGWEGSPLWDVKVLGEFPKSTEDTVCPLASIEKARDNAFPPERVDECVVACDVARFGSDETIIAVRHGHQIRLARKYTGRDLMQTAGAIIEVVREQRSLAKPRIVVDDVGLGGGVTDRLREQGYEVTAFNAGSKARNDHEYPNARSELWFAFADRLTEIDLDADEQLAADLVSPRYKLDSSGRRVVEAKEITKGRIGRSPDRADAVLMTFATESSPALEVW